MIHGTAFEGLALDRALFANADRQAQRASLTKRYESYFGPDRPANKRVIKAVLRGPGLPSKASSNGLSNGATSTSTSASASSGDEGYIVGLGLWEAPLSTEEAVAAKKGQGTVPMQLPEGSNVAASEAFYAVLARHSERVQNDLGPHWHLNVLATDKAYRQQARGAGSESPLLSGCGATLTARAAEALLQWGLDLAAQSGHPVDLEAVEGAVLPSLCARAVTEARSGGTEARAFYLKAGFTEDGFEGYERIVADGDVVSEVRSGL